MKPFGLIQARAAQGSAGQAVVGGKEGSPSSPAQQRADKKEFQSLFLPPWGLLTGEKEGPIRERDGVHERADESILALWQAER
jgi:hypothetical protein